MMMMMIMMMVMMMMMMMMMMIVHNTYNWSSQKVQLEGRMYCN